MSKKCFSVVFAYVGIIVGAALGALAEEALGGGQATT